MTNYDVIIAGAGPSGSVAARQLANNGARVLLLDKQKFPRDKPCGGGVTMRAATAQDADLTPVVERTIYAARFSLRLGDAFDRRLDRPLTYMTQRSHLDQHLAERAAEAGADLHDGEAVRQISFGAQGAAPNHHTVRVSTDRDSYSAQIMIGADGANGISGRSLGLRPDYEEAVALEGNVMFRGDVPEDWRDVVALDLGGLAGGYGWVFPKADHLNIGVGAWKYASLTLKPKLAELSQRYGFDPASLENLRGHHLPVRKSGTPIARGPVALVGDAAGLVDPLTGEGIHMAFASGRLAAEHSMRVLSGVARDMTGYQSQVDSKLQRELDVSRQLQELFNFAPPPYLAMMRRSEKLWHLFCGIIRGDITYLDFVRMIGPMRFAVEFLAGIAQRRRMARVDSGLQLLAAGRAS